MVEFRDRVELKPKSSVIRFKPNGPRCLVVCNFMRNRVLTTPVPDAFLFPQDTPDEPPRVLLETLDTSSTLFHVVEEQYVNDDHNVQTGRRCHSLIRRETQQNGGPSVRHDFQTVDSKRRDEEKVSKHCTFQPLSARVECLSGAGRLVDIKLRAGFDDVGQRQDVSHC